MNSLIPNTNGSASPDWRQFVLATTSNWGPPDIGYFYPAIHTAHVPCLRMKVSWSCEKRTPKIIIKGWDLRAGAISQKALAKLEHKLPIKPRARRPDWADKIYSTVIADLKKRHYEVKSDPSDRFIPAKGAAPFILHDPLQIEYLAMHLLTKYWLNPKSGGKARKTDLEGLGITVNDSDGNLGNVFKRIGLDCLIRKHFQGGKPKKGRRS